jgi:hypothetical protein
MNIISDFKCTTFDFVNKVNLENLISALKIDTNPFAQTPSSYCALVNSLEAPNLKVEMMSCILVQHHVKMVKITSV